MQCPVLGGWTSIEQVITHLVRQYQQDSPLINEPIDINRGDCENFGFEVVEHWPSAYTVGVEEFQLDDKFDWGLLSNDHWKITVPANFTVEQIDSKRLGGHVWIVDGNKHYDAECPDGVDSFFDLPYFQRQLNYLTLNPTAQGN